MKKLFSISLDSLLGTLASTLKWILLGYLVDKNLINIISLIYPIQFITSSIHCIFGNGANISAIKDKNPNSVFSGIFLGGISGILFLTIIIIYIEKYISFFNMDVAIYKVFLIYAVIHLFLQLIYGLLIKKLYYEDKNKIANKYSLWFNLISLLSIILVSCITKEQVIIVSFTTIATAMYVCFMIYKTVEINKIKINIINCIKYDSLSLLVQISMFIIYIFGIKVKFNMGEKYILATSFSALITDSQWEISYSIYTITQILITQKAFVYKEHMSNCKKLIFLLIISTLIMGIALYPYYKTDIVSTTIFVFIELISLYCYPIYITKLMFIQLEYSALKSNINIQIANVLRIFCSFIPSPYCTSIGLIVYVIYLLIATQFIITKNKITMINKEQLS